MAGWRAPLRTILSSDAKEKRTNLCFQNFLSHKFAKTCWHPCPRTQRSFAEVLMKSHQHPGEIVWSGWSLCHWAALMFTYLEDIQIGKTKCSVICWRLASGVGSGGSSIKQACEIGTILDSETWNASFDWLEIFTLNWSLNCEHIASL